MLLTWFTLLACGHVDIGAEGAEGAERAEAYMQKAGDTCDITAIFFGFSAKF